MILHVHYRYLRSMLMVWFAKQRRNILFIKPNGTINAINLSFEERFFTKGIFLRLWFLDQNNCFIASKQPLKYQPSIILHSWVSALWRFLVCLHFFAKSSIKKRKIKNKTHLCNIVGHKNSEAAHHRCCYIRVFLKYAANLQENTHTDVWFQKSCKATYYYAAFEKQTLQGYYS